MPQLSLANKTRKIPKDEHHTGSFFKHSQWIVLTEKWDSACRQRGLGGRMHPFGSFGGKLKGLD